VLNGQDRTGTVGWAGQVRRGKARHGLAWRGAAGQERPVSAGLGAEQIGLARFSGLGRAGQVAAWRGTAWQAWRGRRGKDGSGVAPFGMAWQAR